MPASAVAEPQHFLEQQIRWRAIEIAFWVATLLPFVLSPNYLPLASQIAITALFALSLDLILGYAGIVSLGHAAFFGVGAYTAGLIAKWGWGEPLTGLVIAALAAGLLGYATSFIIARFRHLALIMITLGLGLLLHEAANSASWLTGGADGLQGVRMWKLLGLFEFDLYGRAAYAYSLVVLFLTFLVARRLIHSPFGLALRGIRENAVAHAGDRRAEPGAHAQGLHHRRGDGRHRRRAADADHRDRVARDAELPALGRRAGDPDPRRRRPALRRHHRRHHLHGGARPVLRHQPAILVLLDRGPAGRGRDLPAQRHPRRPGAAHAGRVEPHVSAPALSTRGLDKSFGSLVVAQDIALELPQGERYALIGPNGAGKTTLINLITGMLRPDRGQIFLGGDEITALKPEQRVKRGLVRTFQINTLFPHLTALEAVTLAVCERRGYAGTWWRALPAYGDAIEEAYAILASLRLGSSCYRPTHELAYGQQRLLEIALALATRPKVLLLDEPAAGVPKDESAELFAVIAGLSQDIAVLFIEHDMNVVFRFANRIIVMVGGRILVEGTPQEIAADARVREVYLGGAHHG